MTFSACRVGVTLRVRCPRCAGLGFVPSPDGWPTRRDLRDFGYILQEGQLCSLCLGACVLLVPVQTAKILFGPHPRHLAGCDGMCCRTFP